MIGSWRGNVLFGALGAFLVFLFSISHNPLGTTLIRGVYAFLAFGAIGLVARFALGALLFPASDPNLPDKLNEERGVMLDLVTPDEERELTERLKEGWTDSGGEPRGEFRPLEPKRLVSIDEADTDKVVQAIREMNEQ